jgi:hypothetical protein
MFVAKQYAVKARKFLITAQKILAKFNVFCLRTSLLSRRFDVHSSLQFKPGSMFDCVVLSFDLHNRDHVKALELLINFRFKLPGIRGILPSLVDDHVKHVFEHVKLRRDHVKLRLELPCLRAITSNFASNFLAQTRSSCDLCLAFVTCNLVGTFGFALVTKFTSGRFRMRDNRIEMR